MFIIGALIVAIIIGAFLYTQNKKSPTAQPEQQTGGGRAGNTTNVEAE